jgi:hypothetical protein
MSYCDGQAFTYFRSEVPDRRDIGFGLALPGTLIERHVRCGKPGCRCHADPPVLHGPYWQWTRKVAGKTITRLVPDEQLDDYRQWLDNDRRLRALVAADAGPHGKRRPSRSTHDTRQTTT